MAIVDVARDLLPLSILVANKDDGRQLPVTYCFLPLLQRLQGEVVLSPILDMLSASGLCSSIKPLNSPGTAHATAQPMRFCMAPTGMQHLPPAGNDQHGSCPGTAGK